jgi:hypothetical protein
MVGMPIAAATLIVARRLGRLADGPPDQIEQHGERDLEREHHPHQHPSASGHVKDRTRRCKPMNV